MVQRMAEPRARPVRCEIDENLPVDDQDGERHE